MTEGLFFLAGISNSPTGDASIQTTADQYLLQCTLTHRPHFSVGLFWSHMEEEHEIDTTRFVLSLEPFFQQQAVHTMTKRDAYVAKMKLQLDELNAKISELEAKAKEAKEDARAKYKEEMTKLRHQSKLAVAKLEELKAAGEDTWETMVGEMEKVRDAFIHSFNYFKSQL